MPDWHVAASLQALLGEINQRWPGRDKRSDGALGDAAHSARVSDHNPDYSAPGARRGVVRARDIDKDGIDLQELLDELRRECRDATPRVAYVIYNGQMMRSYRKTIAGRTYEPGEWSPYDGPNPHIGHVHVSINHTAAAEADTSPWFTPKEEVDYMATTEGKAQLDRIELAVAKLAAAESARYADLANRVQAGNDEERGRYKYYSQEFGAIRQELADDPASPVQA